MKTNYSKEIIEMISKAIKKEYEKYYYPNFGQDKNIEYIALKNRDVKSLHLLYTFKIDSLPNQNKDIFYYDKNIDVASCIIDKKTDWKENCKEFSCSNCSKPNDVGVKKCWWCEVNFNE